MKKLFTFFAFLSFAIVSHTQSFEGSIAFNKETASDTISYVYYVKGDWVRIDEIGRQSKKVVGTFLINLAKNTIVSLSHERKLYIEQSPSPAESEKGKSEVTATQNSKTILGEKCTEYVVKNPEQKTKITYWLASGKYDFFLKMLKLMNRKDRPSLYYQQISGANGTFPFLSIQINTETGKEEVRMTVTKTEKKMLADSLFEIPKDYKKFQK